MGIALGVLGDGREVERDTRFLCFGGVGIGLRRDAIRVLSYIMVVSAFSLAWRFMDGWCGFAVWIISVHKEHNGWREYVLFLRV